MMKITLQEDQWMVSSVTFFFFAHGHVSWGQILITNSFFFILGPNFGRLIPARGDDETTSLNNFNTYAYYSSVSLLYFSYHHYSYLNGVLQQRNLNHRTRPI